MATREYYPGFSRQGRPLSLEPPYPKSLLVLGCYRLEQPDVASTLELDRTRSGFSPTLSKTARVVAHSVVGSPYTEQCPGRATPDNGARDAASSYHASTIARTLGKSVLSQAISTCHQTKTIFYCSDTDRTIDDCIVDPQPTYRSIIVR